VRERSQGDADDGDERADSDVVEEYPEDTAEPEPELEDETTIVEQADEDANTADTVDEDRSR
jgi:hypothetical protein